MNLEIHDLLLYLSEVSTGQDFLSCPALFCFLPSSWRAAGQDRTGHQDTRTASHVFHYDQIATQLRRTCDRTVTRDCEKLRRSYV